VSNCYIAAAVSGTAEVQGNSVRLSRPETDKIWTERIL